MWDLTLGRNVTLGRIAWSEAGCEGLAKKGKKVGVHV